MRLRRGKSERETGLLSLIHVVLLSSGFAATATAALRLSMGNSFPSFVGRASANFGRLKSSRGTVKATAAAVKEKMKKNDDEVGD